MAEESKSFGLGWFLAGLGAGSLRNPDAGMGEPGLNSRACADVSRCARRPSIWSRFRAAACARSPRHRRGLWDRRPNCGAGVPPALAGGTPAPQIRSFSARKFGADACTIGPDLNRRVGPIWFSIQNQKSQIQNRLRPASLNRRHAFQCSSITRQDSRIVAASSAATAFCRNSEGMPTRGRWACHAASCSSADELSRELLTTYNLTRFARRIRKKNEHGSASPRQGFGRSVTSSRAAKTVAEGCWFVVDTRRPRRDKESNAQRTAGNWRSPRKNHRERDSQTRSEAKALVAEPPVRRQFDGRYWTVRCGSCVGTADRQSLG